MSLTAETFSTTNLGTVVSKLWPSVPDAVQDFLLDIEFPAVQVTFNSTVKRLGVLALPINNSLPSLSVTQTNMGGIFSYYAPVLKFAAGQALADASFEISMTLDLPLLGIKNASASLRASPATTELELLVGSQMMSNCFLG
jgi:hypothetical protein